MSLEAALANRRSLRNFSATGLTRAVLSQLLWAGQGITDGQGHRTTPSAGPRYPLELYVVLPTGCFHYNSKEHQLQPHLEGDLRSELRKATLDQESVEQAPAVVVITGVYQRTIAKYGEKMSPRFVHFEAGHCAQNMLLQATSLGLGGVPLGGLNDEEVSRTLSLPPDHQPLYVIPFGHP